MGDSYIKALDRDDVQLMKEYAKHIPYRHFPRNVGKVIGRNDKCPCGSEKKFKKCCL